MRKGSSATRVKQQHFIPRYYLRLFASPTGTIHCFRRSEDKFFRSNIDDICTKRNLHEVSRLVPTGNGGHLKDNYIEKRLSEIENRLALLYCGLLTSCEKGDLTSETAVMGRLYAYFLLSWMTERHPKAIKDRRRVGEEIAERYFRAGKYSNADRELMRCQGAEEELVGMTEIFAMQVSLLSFSEKGPVFRFWNQLCSKRFVIFLAPVGVEFISTSLPIYFISDGTPDSFQKTYMPLSSRYAIVVTDDFQESYITTATIEQVTNMNLCLLSFHDVWDTAFSKSKGPLMAVCRDWSMFGQRLSPLI